MGVNERMAKVPSECFISLAHVSEAEELAGIWITDPANQIKIRIDNPPAPEIEVKDTSSKRLFYTGLLSTLSLVTMAFI